MQPVMTNQDADFGGEWTDSNLCNNNSENDDNCIYDGLSNEKMSNMSIPSKQSVSQRSNSYSSKRKASHEVFQSKDKNPMGRKIIFCLQTKIVC